jgi:redox-sensitive bicupin YhaK (pirin superfamily)
MNANEQNQSHDNLEQECEFTAGCDAIKLVITPRITDLGEFSVRRTLPNRQCKTVGPWLFFDHMGPADFPAGGGINVRPHPHINLATVTYLFEGEILHRDSLGSLQSILPGDINLMVAGSGIVHSERERPEINQQPHRLHGLQLWMALPTAFEEIDPAFYHYPSAEIPATQINDVPVRVLIGSAYGVTSPVKTYSETLYLEAELQQGQTLVLPDTEERALYLAKGQLQIKDQQINEFDMVVLTAAHGVTITAMSHCRIALIGGANIGPRFIDWNFVSSRKERIEQAKKDWQDGKFPKVVGDEVEFIPLPKS